MERLNVDCVSVGRPQSWAPDDDPPPVKMGFPVKVVTRQQPRRREPGRVEAHLRRGVRGARMMTASELIAGLTTDAALNLRDAASKMYLFRAGGRTWDALPAADKTLLVTASAVAVVENQTPGWTPSASTSRRSRPPSDGWRTPSTR